VLQNCHGDSIYHLHPIPQFNPNMSQLNPVQTCTTYFSNTPNGMIFEVLTVVLLEDSGLLACYSVKW